MRISLFSFQLFIYLSSHFYISLFSFHISLVSLLFRFHLFFPISYFQVAWYRIFARSATGSNVKARLSDYHFLGTGEQVPYHHHELRISGLKANEKYVIAVAAYTADGKLIGDSVGDSTKPILANHPLPVLTTWAFLSQVC